MSSIKPDLLFPRKTIIEKMSSRLHTMTDEVNTTLENFWEWGKCGDSSTIMQLP